MTVVPNAVKLTPARRYGLLVLATHEPKCSRRSNVSDRALGYVYWQTADWLIENGLVEPAMRELLRLTDAGRELARRQGML